MVGDPGVFGRGRLPGAAGHDAGGPRAHEPDEDGGGRPGRPRPAVAAVRHRAAGGHRPGPPRVGRVRVLARRLSLDPVDDRGHLVDASAHACERRAARHAGPPGRRLPLDRASLAAALRDRSQARDRRQRDLRAHARLGHRRDGLAGLGRHPRHRRRIRREGHAGQPVLRHLHPGRRAVRDRRLHRARLGRARPGHRHRHAVHADPHARRHGGDHTQRRDRQREDRERDRVARRRSGAYAWTWASPTTATSTT